MKKILLLVAVFMLTACGANEVDEGIAKEENYVLMDIDILIETDPVVKFLYSKKSIDKVKMVTETETIVGYLGNITFLKTENESSTVNVKKTKFKNGYTRSDFKLHLNVDDVKKISGKYADIYKKTLEFGVQ